MRVRALFPVLAAVLIVALSAAGAIFAQELAPAPVPAGHGCVAVDFGCAKYTCPPHIVYKGCPAPCSITRVVTVTRPCHCCTVDVLVQVPACGCERTRIERDGDMELDYGKYEVEIDWKDKGRKLVVRYDD